MIAEQPPRLTLFPIVEDITRHRHGGNPESVAAFTRVSKDLPADRAACLRLIKQSPKTAKECATALGKTLNSVSGRLSELKRDRLIEPTGERRHGSAVLRVRA